MHPGFMVPFSGPLHFAGLMPRAVIDRVQKDSSALGQLLPGDVILSMTYESDGATVTNPTVQEVRARLEKASRYFYFLGREADIGHTTVFPLESDWTQAANNIQPARE